MRNMARGLHVSYTLKPPTLPLLLLLILLLLLTLPQTSQALYRDCGGEIANERGFIHSPNFPHPFPDPISCTWILRAPPGKKIQLHFTQYFLRESFYLAEFDTYTSPTVFTGRSDLGPVDFREHIRSVVGLKPVLSIEFRSWGKKNIHLRVEEFLTDVYGFNVTYEMVNVTEPLTNSTCSVSGCSFLGHCYVRGDWSEYYCDCFPGYYGGQCEFGPHCDPKAGRNTCLNGGSCRYFYGSYVNMCLCPPGYTGVKCEVATDHPELPSPDEECRKLRCSQLCEKRSGTNRVFCACNEGFRLAADNITCQLIELHRVTVDLYTSETHYTEKDVLSRAYVSRARRQMNMLMQFSRLPRAKRFAVDSYRPAGEAKGTRTLRFHFYTDSGNVHAVNLLFRLISIRGRLFNITMNKRRVVVYTSPELRILSVENYEGRAAPEGSFSNLVCRARGSNFMLVRWYKDGQVVNTSLTTRNIWQTLLLEGEEHTRMSILNINDITIYDKGVFTCEVEDYGEIQRQDVMLDVVTSPSVVITPGAANVRQGETVSFRCFSPDGRLHSYRYSWRKNGVPIDFDKEAETEEDVQPTGKRLTLAKAYRAANYTCVVTSDIISASSTVRLFVTDKENRCKESTARGIHWSDAVHGGFDVQKCPQPMHGLASRACRCGQKNCTWSAPNYARCQTIAFISVFDKTEQLRLGYQGWTLAGIYTELLFLLRNRSRETVIPGDVTLSSRMILNGIATAVDIPDLLVRSAIKIYPELLLELMSLLMNLATRATTEERRDQKILTRSLLTMEMISQLMENALPQLHNGYFQDALLVAAIKEYQKYIPQTTTAHPKSEETTTHNPATNVSNIHNIHPRNFTRKQFRTGLNNKDRNDTRVIQETNSSTTPAGNLVKSSSLHPRDEDPPTPNDPESSGKKIASKDSENRISAEELNTAVNSSVRTPSAQNGDKQERPDSKGKDMEQKRNSSREAGEKYASVIHDNVRKSGKVMKESTTPDNSQKNAEFSEEERRQNDSLDLSGKFQRAETFQVLEIVHDDSMMLVDFPHRNDSKYSEWEPMSHIRSVLPIGGLWRSQRFRTPLTFHHDVAEPVSDDIQTACFALINYRHSLEQQWSGTRCSVLESGTNFTTCLCSLPVHVAVFVRAKLSEDEGTDGPSVESTVLLVGCILALCGICITLLCYLWAYRTVGSVFHIIRLNIILALMLVLILCVMCLQGRHLEILCITGRLLLHLTLLTLFAFLFVDTLHMYLTVHALTSHNLITAAWKFVLIGWGIPVFSVGSTAVASSRFGHNDKCHVWCWVEPSTWQFYPFLVPMLVLMLSSVLISAKCVWTVYPWTDEWRYRTRKKQILRASKNGAILLMLLGVTWSGCDVDNDGGYGAQSLFVCLLLLLVAVVFTSYCVSDKTVVQTVFVVFGHRARRLVQNSSTHSFRAFIMPEKIEDGEENNRVHTEEQTIHRLCTQRNNKYTTARKRELRFLLGSSSGSSDSSGASGDFRHSSEVSGRPRRHVYTSVGLVVRPGEGSDDEEGGAESDFKTDSGICVEGTSEKSSDKSGSSSRRHSRSGSEQSAVHVHCRFDDGTGAGDAFLSCFVLLGITYVLYMLLLQFVMLSHR